MSVRLCSKCFGDWSNQLVQSPSGFPFWGLTSCDCRITPGNCCQTGRQALRARAQCKITQKQKARSHKAKRLADQGNPNESNRKHYKKAKQNRRRSDLRRATRWETDQTSWFSLQSTLEHSLTDIEKPSPHLDYTGHTPPYCLGIPAPAYEPTLPTPVYCPTIQELFWGDLQPLLPVISSDSEG